MKPGQLTPLLLLASAALYSAEDPQRSSGWVVIPVPEYQALRNKAFPVEPQPAPPPVEATLTRVDYELRVVNGELTEGEARLTVDVLKDGWVRVPIPAGLIVREAKLDGKLVALTRTGSGRSALLSKRGRSVLQLEVGFPIASAAGDETLTLPAGGSGVTCASVRLPRQDVELKLTGGFLASKSETQAETKWVAYGHGAQDLVFTWRKKMEDHRTTLPLRLRGSLTELLGLGEDSTSVFAEVKVDVVQGEAREVRIQLPDKVTVNQVLGAAVADWEMKAGELDVTFLEPVQQKTSFTLSGEARLARDGAIEAPLLRLLDTERETGGVAVEVLGAGEIKDLKSQGLEKTDASELGPAVSGHESPSLAAFRFRAGVAAARSLSLNVARYAQQAVLTANVEEARYRVLMTSEGKTLVEARYAVRNNQRNFVKIGLPAGAVVWSASRSGRPVRPGQAPDGGLLFPLDKAHAGEEAPTFAIEILYLAKGPAWDDKGEARLVLPVLDLPVSRTGLSLYYPPLFRVTPAPGSFRTGEYAAPAATVLKAEGVHGPADDAPWRPGTDQRNNWTAAQAAIQSLASDYRSRSENRKTAVPLPAGVSFPALGSSLFLVSELTGDGHSPTIDLTYQKGKNGGVK